MTTHIAPGHGKLPLAPAANSSYRRTERRTAMGRNATPRSCVGVLPFVNTTAEPTVDQFSEEFTNILVDAIRVDGGFEDATLSPRLQSDGETIHLFDIGRKLKVDLLLIGDVRISDGSLSAAAMLVHAETRRCCRIRHCEIEATIRIGVERRVAKNLARQLKASIPLSDKHATPSDKQYL